MSDELRVEDFLPPTTPSDGFAVVNRDALMCVLDAIMDRRGDTDWCLDAARKLHFGLAHGLGTVEHLLVQIREEREANRAILKARTEEMEKAHAENEHLKEAVQRLLDVQDHPTYAVDEEEAEEAVRALLQSSEEK